jgi:CTP-dependent riboflavin kinase
LTFVNKTNIEQIMASVLDELIEELQAKQKRIDKEIINLDRSSVIPQHYNKADDILTLTDEAIKCEDTLLLQKYNRVKHDRKGRISKRT